MSEKLRRLKRTVEGLGGILESYQIDIRSQELDRQGFCQGIIYLEDGPRLVREALQLIEWMEEDETGTEVFYIEGEEI